MKKFLLLLLAPCLSLSALAQNNFEAKAILSPKEGGSSLVWVLAATDKGIRYKTTAVATDHVDAKIADFGLIYLMEPADYSEAVDLFESEKLKEAKEKFIACKEIYKPTATLKGNFHTLSAFYEMECMRKLGDYEGLATALGSFDKDPLTRADHLRQLDLYVMWNALKDENWDSLMKIASAREDEKLPGYQRAQVAFCKGMALQNKEEPQLEDALLQYSIAMTADAGASRMIAQDAALNSLMIYFEDEQVQIAMANWGTADEAKGSVGYARLKEAAGLAKIYENFLKVDKALSEDTAKFLNYSS